MKDNLNATADMKYAAFTRQYRDKHGDAAEFVAALVQALELCEIDFAGDMPEGDDPHSKAVTAVRNILSVAR